MEETLRARSSTRALHGRHGFGEPVTIFYTHWQALKRIAISNGLAVSTVAALLALLTLLVRLSIGPLTVDDAYITFRYARNLAEGLGFAYNPGEQVLGTTTPLYTLLLAGLYRLGFHDLPNASLVLGSLADVATALILLRLAARLGMGLGWGALSAALFALSQAAIAFTVGGMESPLFTLLVIGAAAADARGRPGWAGLAAGLATLARPEGVLIGALVLGRHALALRLPPRRAVLAYLAPLGPWVAFAGWWFGSPLPQSVAAKAIPYQISPAMNLLGLLMYLSLGWIGILLVVSPLLLARAGRLRGRSELWPLAAFAPLLTGAYVLAALRSVLLFPWYVVPLAPFYVLGIVVAFRAVSQRVRRPLVTMVVVSLLLSLLPGLNLGYWSDRGPLAPRYLNLVREEAFSAAGRYLAPHLNRDSLVALPEIGAFGYATEARILDTIGLVSPQATRFYPLPPGYVNQQAIPPQLIREQQPDYIVGLEEFFQTLQETDWFDRDYQPVKSFKAHAFHSDEVVVYGKVGAGGQGAGAGD